MWVKLAGSRSGRVSHIMIDWDVSYCGRRGLDPVKKKRRLCWECVETMYRRLEEHRNRPEAT